jgi:hypothetical protein
MNTRLSAARLKRNLPRARASAAAVPNTVEIVVETTATAILVRSEAVSATSFQASAYHFQVNPDQTALYREAFRDRTTRTMIGAYRNA